MKHILLITLFFTSLYATGQTVTANSKCEGATCVLDPGNTGTGCTFTYKWNDNTTTATKTVTVGASSTNYFVTVTCKDASGCEDQKVQQFTVAPAALPTCTFADQTVCAGGNLTWTYATNGATCTVTGPGNYVSTAACGSFTLSNITAAMAGTYTITIDGPAGSGCQKECTAVLTVTSAPVATITGDSDLCIGTSATYTGAPTGGTWSVVSGGGTITTGGVYTANNTAGTAVIRYSMPAAGGCPAYSVDKTITKRSPLTATITGPTAVCQGGTATYTSNRTGTWSVVNGTGAATITSGGVLTATTAGTVTVKLSYAGGYNCGTQEKTLTVTVNPKPTFTLSPTAC